MHARVKEKESFFVVLSDHNIKRNFKVDVRILHEAWETKTSQANLKCVRALEIDW